MITLVAIGLVAVVLVPLLAVTFLGRTSSQRFERVGTPIGPSSGSRTATGSPDGEPALGTHWHSAYGIYLCDDFIEPLVDDGQDAHGIHTHGDGLIHIHPFDTTVTGERATLGAFADQVGIDAIPGGGIRLPDGTEVTTCDGDPVGLMIMRWDADHTGAWPDLEFADFEELQFEQDHEVITIAVVSRNRIIDGDFYDEVLPPSAELLTEYGATPTNPSTSTTQRPTTTSEPPQPASPIGALWLLGADMDELPVFGPGDETPTMARIEELTGTSPGTLEPLAGLVPDRATAVFGQFPDLGPTQVITMRAATPEDAQAFLAELRRQHAGELTDFSTDPDFQTEPWEGLGADYTWTTPDGRRRVTSAGIDGTDIVISIAGDIDTEDALLATSFSIRFLTGEDR